MQFKCKITAAMTLAVLISLTSAARAEDQPALSASASVTYAERYIWRGLPLNEEAVLQPGVSLSRGGLTLGAWSSLDLTDYGEDAGYGDESGNPTEIDFTAAYSIPLGDKVKLTGGFITYTFPHTYFSSTTEIFAGLALDVPGSPSVTTYLDEDLNEGGNYTSLDAAHTFTLAEQGDWGLGLSLAGHVGYANHKYFELYYGLDETPNWSDWSASVGLPVSLPAGFSVTPGYLYGSIILEEAADVIDDAGLDPDNGAFMVNVAWSGDL